MVAIAVPPTPSTMEATVPLMMAGSEKDKEKKPVKYNIKMPGIALEVSANAAT